MSSDTTVRLVETDAVTGRDSVTVIRWVSQVAGLARHTRLDRNRISLGRGDDSDVRLEAAGVSRRHAELVRQGPVYVLSDRGSTNGTHVNGQAAAHMPLSPNDVVRLGEVVGVVMRLDAAALEAESDVSEPWPGAIFGPGLQAQLADVCRVGPSSLPVVIVGHTGTGKEYLARALHSASARRGALHAVNCSAIPALLAEAELFGHRRGAFTGAEQAGIGHFRAAQAGTLFLDELAELPLPVQAKLLRAIQEREVTPLGEIRATAIDVRFVAAVQAPLSELVSAGKVREDLAMRLSGAVIALPPLCERRVDIAVLFSFFLARNGGGRSPNVEARLLEDLLLYAFPGNVRELELLVRGLLVRHGHEQRLRRSMLPPSVLRNAPLSLKSPASDDVERHAHDLNALARELRRNGNNLARAAKAVGVSRQRAYRLLAGRSHEELLQGSREQDAKEARQGSCEPDADVGHEPSR